MSGRKSTQWPIRAALPEALRGPDATPANDGVANIVKYALGVSPMASAAARLPAEVVTGTGDGDGYPVIHFIRSKNAPGIQIQVESSTTPEFLDDLGWTLLGVEDLGDGSERVSARSNAAFASQNRQFFRLRVSGL